MELPHDVEHSQGLISMLGGLLLAFCLHVVMKIINMGITIVKNLREADGKKIEKLSESLEKNTRAVHELTTHLKGLEQRLVDTDKEALRLESRHALLVAAVKELAGVRWQEIQQKIKDDQFIERPE
jgi:hypothetical protein